MHAAHVSGEAASGERPAEDMPNEPVPESGQRPICWSPPHGAVPSTTSTGRAWALWGLRKFLPAPPAEALADNLELVASELITNGIVHGGEVTEVCLQLHGPRVRLSVRDRPSTNPSSWPADSEPIMKWVVEWRSSKRSPPARVFTERFPGPEREDGVARPCHPLSHPPALGVMYLT
ncbi:hypothetical protein Vau01_105490 [Virgisporangium aurantiacum]|uniref:Histidine kinase/HSP90-like ATPase domain-containing protein n=1 Tax=Virgisporangium aurantiacum TaxID=175570 RepID=A0A8J3ZHR4_9ACTN|nr:hypothetical protein Vau01_105490 [Virgisporangium aurantiacum]